MGKEFVPKKTITVQLDFETWDKFQALCQKWGLPKTKTAEKLILDAAVGNMICDLHKKEMEE